METIPFNELVENIKSLTTEEKEEIKFLVGKYIAEDRREQIYKNYQASLNELKGGRLNFSRKIKALPNAHI